MGGSLSSSGNLSGNTVRLTGRQRYATPRSHLKERRSSEENTSTHGRVGDALVLGSWKRRIDFAYYLFILYIRELTMDELNNIFI
jgi:hypothetical protein